MEPISHEPWVRLADGRELQNWGREEEIAYNQKNRQAQKLAFYVNAFDFITDSFIKGDYHEYGCHRARTFRMALTEARRHNLDTMKFFAFDSFQGLPKVGSQPTTTPWQEGALLTSEEEFRRLIDEHGIYVDRVITQKGFYKDLLVKNLQDRFLAEEAKIAFCCIDCDLYESAVPVFDYIEPLLQEGTLIYLDDYYGGGYKGSPEKGVAQAFSQFQETSQFKFEPYVHVGWHGRSFIAYLDR